MVMKIVIYKEDDIQTVANLINSLDIRGFEQARIVSKIGDILDSGEIKNKCKGEIQENGAKSDNL